jgi:hypothetical protein
MTAKAIAFFLAALILGTAPVQTGARPSGDLQLDRTCEDDDPDVVDNSGRNVAVDAYEFSLKILDAVEARDMAALFRLVNGELSGGPRRRFVRDKSFAEIFPEAWRRRVLDTEPSCSRVGWRGYMLGHGMIWFDKKDDVWTITGINGAAEEAISSNPWGHDGALLSGACFTTMWMSGDNYEAYAYQFRGIPDFDVTPGRYFGGPVPLEPIVAISGGKLYLAVKLSECVATAEARGVALKEGWASMQSCKPIGYDPPPGRPELGCHEVQYSVIKRIGRQHCAQLAPHLVDHCLDLALVRMKELNGGSMGPTTYFSIYGIIKNPVDGEVYVVPLVLFEGWSDALNYVDGLDG